MQQVTRRGLAVVLAVAAMMLIGQAAIGQRSTTRQGRKYKAPPETARVVVTVIKATNGKPIHNAAVVFHSSKDDKDDGNLEMKTDVDGKASIDVIPLGSKVQVQVIADGYATYGEDYQLGTDTTKEIIVKMIRPKAQYSAYTADHQAKDLTKPGLQEPDHSATASPAPSAPPPATAKQPK